MRLHSIWKNIFQYTIYEKIGNVLVTYLLFGIIAFLCAVTVGWLCWNNFCNEPKNNNEIFATETQKWVLSQCWAMYVAASNIKRTQVFMQSNRHFLTDLNTIEFHRQTHPNFKFQENLSSWSQIYICQQTEGQTRRR